LTCDETVVCNENQCLTNTHSCTDGRNCIFGEIAGYTCSESCPVNKVPEGRYGCKQQTAFLLIVTLIPIFGGLLLIAIILAALWYRNNNYDYGVTLPNEWFGTIVT